MIKAFCDMCEEEIKNNINTIKVPRITNYYMHGAGSKRTYIFDKVKTCTTIVCDDCYEKIANLFIKVE